jgi:hypothetical protein
MNTEHEDIDWRVVAYTGDTERRYVREVQLLDAGRALEASMITVVGKNPSNADNTKGDPTTRAIEAWARFHGFGRIRLVNLFSRRSPSPSALDRGDYDDTVGARNDDVLRAAVGEASHVIAAWGGIGSGTRRMRDVDRYHRRIDEVVHLVGAGEWSHVGRVSQAGYPLHGYHWNGLSDCPQACECGGRMDFPASCAAAEPLGAQTICVASASMRRGSSASR